MEMRVQILPKEKERYKKLFRIVFERDPTQEEIKNYMSTTDQRLKEVTQKGYERSVRKKINEWRPSSSKDDDFKKYNSYIRFRRTEEKQNQQNSKKALRNMSELLSPQIAQHILSGSGVKNTTLRTMSNTRQLKQGARLTIKLKKQEKQKLIEKMIQVLRETTGCKELRLGFNNVTSEHEYEHEYYQAYGIYGIPINPDSQFRYDPNVQNIHDINPDKKTEFLTLLKEWGWYKIVDYPMDSPMDSNDQPVDRALFLALGIINQPYYRQEGEIVPCPSRHRDVFSSIYDYGNRDIDPMEHVMKNYSKSNLKKARHCFSIHDREIHDKFNHLLTWEDQYLLSQERKQSKILGSLFFVVGTVLWWYGGMVV